MNIRKPVDYSTMYETLDQLMVTDLPQVELYFEIGRAVCARAEKGAAVAASEYLQRKYPHATGFSPRNVRRMRKFCRTYENVPELTRLAMKIGWTQNIVILEACKTTKERAWYFVSVLEHNWTKTELLRKIQNEIWLNSGLDEVWDSCYTKENIMILEHQKNDKDSFHQSPEYMPKSYGRIYHEEIGTKSWIGAGIPHRISGYQSGGDWQPGVSSCLAEAGPAWNRVYWQNGPPAPKRRLRSVRSADRDGSRESPRYVPYLWRRFRWEDAPLDGVRRSAGSGGSRSLVYRRLRGHLEGCASRVSGNFEGNGETQRWINWLSREWRSMCSGISTGLE